MHFRFEIAILKSQVEMLSRQFDICPRAQGRSLDKMCISEMEFKAMQLHRCPRKWVLMERKGFQHSEDWKKRSPGKGLEGAVDEIEENLSRCEVLSEKVINYGKCCWETK